MESRYESEEAFKAGTAIFLEGDESETMFVVQSGRVRLSRELGSGPFLLGEITKGGFFGEMSLLEGVPRGATATAVTDTRVLVLEPDALVPRFRTDPTFALEIVQRLSSRLRRMNDRLAEAYQAEAVGCEELDMKIDIHPGDLARVVAALPSRQEPES